MLHDVIISVSFSIDFFSYKSYFFVYNVFFPYLLPPEGNLDIDAGDGDGGGGEGQIIAKNHQKSQNIFRTNIVHTSGTFFKEMCKTIFKIS